VREGAEAGWSGPNEPPPEPQAGESSSGPFPWRESGGPPKLARKGENFAIPGTVSKMATRLGMQLEREFEHLYRRHRREVYRSVLRDVRDPDEAEDVTQTAFLDAYRALQRGDEPLRPRAWLLTIARNAARRRYRARAAAPREVELDVELLIASGEAGPSAVEIRQALARLGARQRKALVLREIAGRSYAEIAAALDLSLPAVETLLFRARRALQRELTDWEPASRSRRRLGGLLLWPPTYLGDLAGSVTGWVARQGAGAKVAGALSVAVLGTGVAIQSVGTGPADPPERRPALHEPAPTLAATRPAATAPARVAARPRTKAEKKPASALPAAPKSVSSPAAALPAVPPLATGPVALPEVTVPAVGELVPLHLPALDEIDIPAPPGSDLDTLP
jgi:RNA polymerase sigma factor (sigma-70 family)